MMAIGQLDGRGSSGGVIAVTDRRLLILVKKAFRPCACDEVTWQQVRSISVTAGKGGTGKLTLETLRGTTKLTTIRAASAKEIARLAGEQVPGAPLTVSGDVGDAHVRAARSPIGDPRRSRRPAVRVLSILVWAVVGLLVFGWPFGSDPDRAPVFAAGGCTTMNGAVVSCDDTSDALLEIVPRPDGARRCDPDSRALSHLVGSAVAQRLKERQLCLVPNSE